MTASPTATPFKSTGTGGFSSWLGRVEDWLDARGKGAWIAAMVLGFIFFWPVGLALLAYMIWSKRMFNRSSSCSNRTWGRDHQRHEVYRSSGNTTFDAYKSETLKRLEDEQAAFEAFLQRLREAKDKSEFDTFMDDRARSNRDANRDAPIVAETPRGGQY
ncbi:MAG: DUF2852 domain-containing protein [Paracoccaceae bacterium]